LTGTAEICAVTAAHAPVATAHVPRFRKGDEVIRIAGQAGKILNLVRRNDLGNFLALRVDFRPSTTTTSIVLVTCCGERELRR